jgi:hypothetical protein
MSFHHGHAMNLPGAVAIRRHAPENHAPIPFPAGLAFFSFRGHEGPACRASGRLLTALEKRQPHPYFNLAKPSFINQ